MWLGKVGDDGVVDDGAGLEDNVAGGDEEEAEPQPGLAGDDEVEAGDDDCGGGGGDAQDGGALAAAVHGLTEGGSDDCHENAGDREGVAEEPVGVGAEEVGVGEVDGEDEGGDYGVERCGAPVPEPPGPYGFRQNLAGCWGGLDRGCVVHGLNIRPFCDCLVNPTTPSCGSRAPYGSCPPYGSCAPRRSTTPEARCWRRKWARNGWG